jgi:hypothetical protein
MKSPAKRRVGRFSTGNEKHPDAPATLRLGSFADGYAATQRPAPIEAPVGASTGCTGSLPPRLTHAGVTADKPLARYAAHLRTIATTLEEESSDGAPAEIAMLSLVYVEHALRDLSHAIDHAGDMLIPLGELHEHLAPGAGDTPRFARTLPPPRERQTQLLTSLRDSSAALRAAADCCHRTRNIIGSPVA